MVKTTITKVTDLFPKYEYCSLPKNLGGDDKLNSLGEDGWQLIAVDQYYMYFSRRSG